MKGTNQVIVLFLFLGFRSLVACYGIFISQGNGPCACAHALMVTGERIIIMINRKKKQIPGLNTRVLWNINPRTRVWEDERKNIKKVRQNGNKLCHSFEN